MTGTVRFCAAVAADLPAVVALLADDALGSTRESADLAPYEAAFAEIDADPRHLVVVGETDGVVIACLQVTVLPCLTHGGRRRAQIEGVRVHRDHRRAGTGEALVRWAIDWASDQGCGVVQLTTDKARPDALRFYERLGFSPTHEGLKLPLDR